MELIATFLLAMHALARNKLRSALTMLGIIIGVSAVIATVGIGQGASAQMQKEITSLGSNLLTVMSGSVNRGGRRMGAGQTKTLIYADATAILRDCPSVNGVAAGTQTGVQVVYGNDNWSTNVIGSEPQYFQLRSWTFAEGAPFARESVDRAENVAVIGETVRRKLFGIIGPLGKTIRIKSIPFRVVGVLKAKGSSGPGGDQDDTIIVPLTTAQKKLVGETWLRWISVSSPSQAASYKAQTEIEALLRDRHRIHAGTEDDFSVNNMAEFVSFAAKMGTTISLLLGSVASVALIVGGIGIMNIMLVSVTERTREIGLRMAIGATEQDVQRQFLIEAMVLSLLGGFAGILTGTIASMIVDQALGWSFFVSLPAIAVSALFSALIGITFGYYPARRAAGLNPIEALRYE
jgi:putative ABC transport system permease protein